MEHENLFGGPEPTLLPVEDDVVAELEDGVAAEALARRHPESSLAWSLLAESAWSQGRELDSYAYARVGYHRGLDSLRRNGWRGQGPVPASHEGNLGFLRCLAALARAADAIGEEAEAERCQRFLADCGGLGS
ncbi:MAG: DUF3151 domain-containing protein [Candidatus Nanopelagicales bacterium]